MEIFDKNLFNRVKKQGKVSKREFELLELLFISGLAKHQIANIMDISQSELFRKLGRLEKKFPGIKGRVDELRNVGQTKSMRKEYRECDLPIINGELQSIESQDSIFKDDHWEKIIKRF